MIAWIVVANSAEARIYSTSADTLTPLKLVMSMSHRQSRLKGAALLSDRPGRVRKTATAPSAFAMEPHTTPKQVEYERFANEVAAALRVARACGAGTLPRAPDSSARPTGG